MDEYIGCTIYNNTTLSYIKIKSINIPDKPRKRLFSNPLDDYTVTIEIKLEELDE